MQPSDKDTFKNTDRDEATTANAHDRQEAQPGLAEPSAPEWRPPEGEPEPRPIEPVLDGNEGSQV